MNALYAGIDQLREEIKEKAETIKKLKSENEALKSAVVELQDFATKKR